MTIIMQSNAEGDLYAASVLDRALYELLTDNVSIRNVPGAFLDGGTINGTLSDTKTLRYAGLMGYDPMVTQAAENTDVGTTALTDAHVDIAVARGALRRDVSDMALIASGGAGPELIDLARDMVGAFDKWFMDLVATAIQSASQDVGSSGVDFSIDNFYEATYELELDSVPGPYFMLLHPRQWADGRESLRGESGIIATEDRISELLKLSATGFKGQFLGVNVITSSRVASSGGNRHGALWGAGALAKCFGIPVVNGAVQYVSESGAAAPILVEWDRDASAATTETVGHGYAGVAIAEQDRICGVVTDA